MTLTFFVIASEFRLSNTHFTFLLNSFVVDAIVIHPLNFEVSVPIFVEKIASLFVRLARVLFNAKRPSSPSDRRESRTRFRVKIDYAIAPVVIVFFLWAITAINSEIVRQVPMESSL